jgi:hypothetical protein
MKKIMMTLAAVCVAATMNAQVYVGGSLGFQTTSHDGDSKNNWEIMPEIGYNLDDSWAVGIALGYSQDKDYDGDKTKKFTINPYARYTFAKFEKVNIFVDGGVQYTHNDMGGAKSNVFGVGLRPGVAVNLNDKLSFVSHFGWLGYKNDKADADGAKAYNTFGFDLDSKVSFGLYYNF